MGVSLCLCLDADMGGGFAPALHHAFTACHMCVYACACRCHGGRWISRHRRSGLLQRRRSVQQSSRQTWSSSAGSCSSSTTHRSGAQRERRGLRSSSRSAKLRRRSSHKLLQLTAAAAAAAALLRRGPGVRATTATPLQSHRRCAPTGTQTWMTSPGLLPLHASRPAGPLRLPAVPAAP